MNKKRRGKVPDTRSRRKKSRQKNPYHFCWEPIFEADNSDPLGLVGKLALCFKSGADIENDDPLTSIQIKSYEAIGAAEIRWMYQLLSQQFGQVDLGEWYGYRADFLRFDGTQVNARFCINYTGSVPLIVTREPNPEQLHISEQGLTEFIVGSVKKRLKSNYEARQKSFRDAADGFSLTSESSVEESADTENEDEPEA